MRNELHETARNQEHGDTGGPADIGDDRQEFKSDDPQPAISNLQSSSDDTDSEEALSVPAARSRLDKL